MAWISSLNYLSTAHSKRKDFSLGNTGVAQSL